MRKRIFPKHIGAYDTVFLQPVFWVLVAVVTVVTLIVHYI
jgi:hypothetical protein